MEPKYSHTKNVKRRAWIFRYKTRNGTWENKWISLTKYPNELKAVAEFLRFYDDYWERGIKEVQQRDKPEARLTIKLIAPMFLELKEKDTFVRQNTFDGFRMSVQNWILDNADHPHHSIENLTLDELNVSEVRQWVNSLTGEYSSRLSHINSLSRLIECAIEEGWVDENYVNPFDRKVIKAHVKKFKTAKGNKKVEFLPLDEANRLISNNIIPEVRRVRYLICLFTGLRDNEVNALTWGDVIKREGIYCLEISKQLVQVGIQPALDRNELIKQKLTRQQMAELKNAITDIPKKNSQRFIPLHPLLNAMLGDWRSRGWRLYVGKQPSNNDPILPRGKGSLKAGEEPTGFARQCKSVIKKDLQRLKIKTPISGIHKLRASFSTHLEKVGVDEREISILLGHSKGSVADKHYIGENLMRLNEAICKLPFKASIQS